MKQISAWASRNVISSIFLIVVLNVFFILLAFYTGASTYQLGFILPTYVLFICGVLIACINIFYFHKRHSYRTRKILEFSFLIICFIGISVLGNQIDNTSYNPVHAAVPVAGLHKTKKPSAEEILVSLKYRDKSSLTRIEKRVLKKEFKVQVKKYVSAKVSGDNETSRRTGLTILAIIAALGVGLLLTALVCSISCNGSAAAALIVGIVGFAALIWGTIALVKHINRKHPKKE